MSGIIKDPMEMTPEERVFKSYYDRLSAFQVEKSRVESHDPVLAAQVANAVAPMPTSCFSRPPSRSRRAPSVPGLPARPAPGKRCAGGSQGRAIPRQEQSLHRQQQHDLVQPAARMPALSGASILIASAFKSFMALPKVSIHRFDQLIELATKGD
jgi:hypothetical protein